jgi:hypothetical protein
MARNPRSTAQSFSSSLPKAALVALAVGFLFDVLALEAALNSVHLRLLDWVLGGGFWIWVGIFRQGAHSATGIIAVMGLNWAIYSLLAFLLGIGIIVTKRLIRRRSTS